jgi:alpha-L-fucosidase
MGKPDQRIGAKYAVITTKHHDGVSLWNSKAENAIQFPKILWLKRCSNSFCSALKNQD